MQPIGGVVAVGGDDCTRCTGGESRTFSPIYEKSVHLKRQVIYGVGTYEASNPDETAKTDVDAKARGEMRREALYHGNVSGWSEEVNEDANIIPEGLWEAILRFFADPNQL